MLRPTHGTYTVNGRLVTIEADHREVAVTVETALETRRWLVPVGAVPTLARDIAAAVYGFRPCPSDVAALRLEIQRYEPAAETTAPRPRARITPTHPASASPRTTQGGLS